MILLETLNALVQQLVFLLYFFWYASILTVFLTVIMICYVWRRK